MPDTQTLVQIVSDLLGQREEDFVLDPISGLPKRKNVLRTSEPVLTQEETPEELGIINQPLEEDSTQELIRRILLEKGGGN